MRTITKMLGAGAAIAALSLIGAHAFADPGHGGGSGRMGMGMGHGMGHGMMGGGRGAGMGQSGDHSERLASAKTRIGIKADQAAAWDAYAKVVTDVAVERRALRGNLDRDAVHNMKPEDRQAFRDTMMKQRDEAQAKVKAAAEALLGKLDDAQKVKAQETLPGLVDGGRGRGQGHGMRHGMMGGPGMGGPGMGGPGMGRGMGPEGRH